MAGICLTLEACEQLRIKTEADGELGALPLQLLMCARYMRIYCCNSKHFLHRCCLCARSWLGIVFPEGSTRYRGACRWLAPRKNSSRGRTCSVDCSAFLGFSRPGHHPCSVHLFGSCGCAWRFAPSANGSVRGGCGASSVADLRCLS